MWRNELGLGPMSVACCRAMLCQRFLLLPHHVRLTQSDENVQQVVRWLVLRLACVEQHLFAHQCAIPRLLLQLWLEAACQQRRQWEHTQARVMVREPGALLEAERSKLIHLLDASTSQQVSALSFRHVFWQLAHPNENATDAAAIFFCVASLPSDLAIPATAANESSAGAIGDQALTPCAMQLWYCNPHRLPVAAFAYAQRAMSDMRPAASVLPACAEALGELAARVMRIGSQSLGGDFVSIGYYFGRFEYQSVPHGVAVELTSRADADNRKHQCSRTEVESCPVFVHSAFSNKLTLYRDLASWLLLGGLSRWYQVLRGVDQLEASQHSLPVEVDRTSATWTKDVRLTSELRLPAIERLLLVAKQTLVQPEGEQHVPPSRAARRGPPHG